MKTQTHLSREIALTVVAGALYDFLGYLTTLPEPLTLGSKQDAAPACAALSAWAAKRALPLDEAAVTSWSHPLGLREPPAPAELDWTAAKAHFDATRQQYQNLEGTPGVNTTIALRFVFDPIARRYNAGERTKDLFDEMMEVK